LRPIPALLAGVWLVLLVAALFADAPVARWVASHHPLDKKSMLVTIVKLPGWYPFTMGVALLLYLCHPQKVRAVALTLIAGAAGGLAYQVMKWLIGRHRPVIGIKPFELHPFVHGLRGLFTEPGLSFPSGHSCLSFATAMSLTILLPRWSFVWFGLALIVAVERIAENAHYVSDVVGGAGLGIVCAAVTWRYVRKWGVAGSDVPATPGKGP
jgi:undecaprenyl-diphosphatase